MNKIIIGLTGGICSGKSVVSKLFETLKSDVIDADIISREVTKKGSVAEAIIAENFKEALSDGVIDRFKLRELVFNDSIKREKLNAITHPLIKKEMERLAKESQNDIVIFVVPLLFESKFNSLTNVTITVSLSEENRIKRLMKRDNISSDLAKKIISSQMSESEREALADYVIYNNGDMESLEAEAENIYKKIISKNSI